MSDPQPIELPDGIWYQPAVDASAVPALAGAEPVLRQRIPARLSYEYTPGAAPSRFLRALKDKRIIGERCPETGKVYVPPRGMSPVAGKPTEEQVELGHGGVVVGFCVVNIQFTGNVNEVPYVSALIVPDGADISIYGLIQEIPFDQVRTGMRVRSVWVDDDQLDTSFENIKWWAPSGEPDADPATYAEHL